MRIRLSIFCILSLLAVSVRAQQTTISYQGAIANAAGAPADSGTYSITVSFYSDESGTQPLWNDTFETMVRKGIFNIALGSGRQLPPPSAFDRPIWVGTRIGGLAESRPLSRLSAVPMSMNVADSAITSAKLNADYISSISVNGVKVTGKASNLNIVGNVQYDDATKSLMLKGSNNSANGKGAKTEAANDTVYWSEKGNHSTTPGTNYVGTSDSVALEIHVNNNGDTNAGNGRVMRYEPMPTSPNVIGGFRTNHLSTGVHGATISGGGSEAFPNQITGDFGTISGGEENYADQGGTVAGGIDNGAYSDGTVAGGNSNTAITYGAVGGGQYNSAGAEYGTVSGGESNTTQASATNPSTYPGLFSSVGGGFGNDIYGAASAIPGGEGMRIGSYSFGFNGDSSFWAIGTGLGYTDLTAVTGIAYFGNVNLMIGNVDSVARQLQFYGPNTDHSYSSGAKFTSFRAPYLTANVPYTLPSSQGTTNQVLTNDGSGNLSWTNQLGASGWQITGNYGTHAPTNFIGTLDSQAFEIHLFDTAAPTGGNNRVMRYEPGRYSPNTVGGSSANLIDTGLSGAAILSGGSLSFPNSISANYSAISGGYGNIIDSNAYLSAISGGSENTVESDESTIGGGENNTIEKYSNNSVIAGGYHNTIHDTSLVFPTQAVISGGTFNLIFNCIATIAGGNNNSIYSGFSSIGGGGYGTINSNSPYGTIAGGDANTIGPNSDHANIAGGGPNTVNSPYSAVGGGQSNIIDTASDHATIAGGDSNTISPRSAFTSILGGSNNLLEDTGAVITGGMNNSIIFTSTTHPSGKGCFIGSGTNNKIDGVGVDTTKPEKGYYSAIVAGNNNTIHSGGGFIGAGENDTITEFDAFIGSGTNNYVDANFSGIVTGSLNYLGFAGYNSLIGAGQQDTIDTNADQSFIGAGEENSIDSSDDFVGAGDFNSIYATASAIVSGGENLVGKLADNSFIGAGGSDTASGDHSFIGGGSKNVTDTGSSHLVGSYASIPGGDHLRTQSYAQTAFGFYNDTAGSTVDAYAAHSIAHMDDQLILAGNGLPDSVSMTGPTVVRHSTAWFVSNGGHSVTTDQLGNAPTTITSPRADPIQGGAYKDNMINAWGDVPGSDTGAIPQHYRASNDFGAASGTAITHTALGTYSVAIRCYNPDGSMRPLSAAAIVVTIKDNSGACGYATASAIGTGGINTFIVHTFSGVGPASPGSCTAADKDFFFMVCGR